MQVFICAIRARPTAGPVDQVLWEAKQVWQNMLLLHVETSRIIRVGARNYIISIAAVSEEHVLVCF